MPLVRTVIVLVALLSATASAAAPRAELWARWTAHDPSATIRVDHAPWDAFLRTYVAPGPDGIARVAYARVTAPDRQALERYIDALSRTAVSGLARPEQMAFWINLYNALTVKVVLDRYPVRSIRDIAISPGLFSIGPWGRKLVEVEGERLSLDDIEHRILRPVWGDARVHYALNCAALGCPDLAGEAYTADGLERMLEANARAFVNHPRGARVEDGRLVVSSIYHWFAEDFGGEAGVIAHLRRYAGPALAQALAAAARIADHQYDWRLNDQPR